MKFISLIKNFIQKFIKISYRNYNQILFFNSMLHIKHQLIATQFKFYLRVIKDLFIKQYLNTQIIRIIFHFICKTKRYCIDVCFCIRKKVRSKRITATQKRFVYFKRKRRQKKIKPRREIAFVRTTEYFSILVDRESNMEIVWFTTYSNTCTHACTRETRSQFCSTLDWPLLAESIDT